MNIKLKNIDEIDFESLELKAEFEAIVKRGEQLLKSTIPDTSTMHRKFTL